MATIDSITEEELQTLRKAIANPETQKAMMALMMKTRDLDMKKSCAYEFMVHPSNFFFGENRVSVVMLVFSCIFPSFEEPCPAVNQHVPVQVERLQNMTVTSVYNI